VRRCFWHVWRHEQTPHDLGVVGVVLLAAVRPARAGLPGWSRPRRSPRTGPCHLQLAGPPCRDSGAQPDGQTRRRFHRRLHHPLLGRRTPRPAGLAGAAWNHCFAGFEVTNLGFGWDRTENVLWRLDHGELDGIKPRVIIIKIGTNNTSVTNSPAISPRVSRPFV